MQIDSGNAISTQTKRVTAKEKNECAGYQDFLRGVFGFKKTPATDKQRVSNTPTVIKEKIAAWKHHPNNLAQPLSPNDAKSRLWLINQWQGWHLGERSAAMRRINKANKLANGGASGSVKVASKSKAKGKGKVSAKQQQFKNVEQPQMNGVEENELPAGSREEVLAIYDELIASFREFEDNQQRHMRRLKDVLTCLNRAAADIKPQN